MKLSAYIIISLVAASLGAEAQTVNIKHPVPDQIHVKDSKDKKDSVKVQDIKKPVPKPNHCNKCGRG